MPNTHQTLQDIADILSFESDQTLLKARLESASMDWDHLVRVGSSHLVLPAIYCRLKAKKFLNTLPSELEAYLKEITDLNRERNHQLLAEAQQISQWFQEAKIDHVFLKGTAMLASGNYEDVAERMVGDIDILIGKSSLQKSHELLIKKDYNPLRITSDPEYQKAFRHLPRLINKNTVGAIELHRHLLRTKNNLIKPLDVLSNKKLEKNLHIPSDLHLLNHNIFNFLINDYGEQLFNLSMRTWYDSEVIQKNHNLEFTSHLYKALFEYHKGIDSNSFIHFFQKQAISQTSVYRFYSYIIHLLRLLITLPKRIMTFILNKDYRKEVLSDKERIRELVKFN